MPDDKSSPALFSPRTGSDPRKIDASRLAKLDDAEFFREVLGQIKLWRSDKASETDASDPWMNLIGQVANGEVRMEDLPDRTRSILLGMRKSIIGRFIKPTRLVKSNS